MSGAVINELGETLSDGELQRGRVECFEVSHFATKVLRVLSRSHRCGNFRAQQVRSEQWRLFVYCIPQAV